MIVSLGLSAISVIGLLMAVFIGVGLVSKEMDKRTLYALLAKPVRRWEFLLGKFGGLLLTLAVNTLAMAAGLFVALVVCEAFIGARGWRAAGCDLFHFVETGAGGGAGAAVFVLHHAAAGDSVYGRTVRCRIVRGGDARLSQRLRRPAMQAFLRWLSYLLPNFENFDVMASAAHGRRHSWRSDSAEHGVRGIVLRALCCAAAAIFSRRNLK